LTFNLNSLSLAHDDDADDAGVVTWHVKCRLPRSIYLPCSSTSSVEGKLTTVATILGIRVCVWVAYGKSGDIFALKVAEKGFAFRIYERTKLIFMSPRASSGFAIKAFSTNPLCCAHSL
jgi:hypothetical protein